MSLKSWVLITLNGLMILVIIVLGLSFYRQFTHALDDRVLLQLRSVKRLKSNQIIHLIESEWETFLKDTTISQPAPFPLPDSLDRVEGMVDLTPYNPAGELMIGFFKNNGSENEKRKSFIEYASIEEILMERTGMGSSGESYIVGADFKLRSTSRFFPEAKPYSIEVRTEGVVDGLENGRGKGIFPDYRGIPVYSAYRKLPLSGLDLVILSEIDVSEAALPLVKMQVNLLFTAFLILVIAGVASLFFIRSLTRPLVAMKNHLSIMSEGNYMQQISPMKQPVEVNEMYKALVNLQDALSGAVQFSIDIGNMKLDQAYTPKSSRDRLGYSLLKMRDELKEFRRKEELQIHSSKKTLIGKLESDRKHLSRELHDGIGPVLTSLKLYIQNRIEDGEARSDLMKILDEAIQEVRLMTYSLMPQSLYDFGLGRAVEHFVSGLQQIIPIHIDFQNLTQPESGIDINLQLNIFRICQELINNTIKHAQATEIRFSISEFEDFVSIYFMDDGVGFDTSRIYEGSGLMNIKERVDIFQGTISVQSLAGSTTFEIEIPIYNEKNQGSNSR